jgi:membrane-bound serine protease (ClpP class)
MGVLLFPNEPLMPEHWFTTFRFTAIGVGLVGAAFILIAVIGIAKLRGRKPVQGDLVSSKGVAASDINPRGFIRVHGEIWQAEAKDGNIIKEGQPVHVVEQEGLLLLVEQINQNKNGG